MFSCSDLVFVFLLREISISLLFLKTSLFVPLRFLSFWVSFFFPTFRFSTEIWKAIVKKEVVCIFYSWTCRTELSYREKSAPKTFQLCFSLSLSFLNLLSVSFILSLPSSSFFLLRVSSHTFSFSSFVFSFFPSFNFSLTFLPLQQNSHLMLFNVTAHYYIPFGSFAFSPPLPLFLSPLPSFFPHNFFHHSHHHHFPFPWIVLSSLLSPSSFSSSDSLSSITKKGWKRKVRERLFLSITHPVNEWEE